MLKFLILTVLSLSFSASAFANAETFVKPQLTSVGGESYVIGIDGGDSATADAFCKTKGYIKATDLATFNIEEHSFCPNGGCPIAYAKGFELTNGTFTYSEYIYTYFTSITCSN
jgi:hypothetical protein